MKSKKAQEKRDARRLAINTKVRVYMVNEKTSRLYNGYFLETRDITEKGLFLKTRKRFPINTRVNLRMKLQKNLPPVIANGKVIWIAKRSQKAYYPGVGIELAKIERGGGKLYKKFLRDKFRNYRHALELKRMYIQLKEMAARLYELGESHPQAKNFRRVIDDTIIKIDYIAHILDREVWEVKSL